MEESAKMEVQEQDYIALLDKRLDEIVEKIPFTTITLEKLEGLKQGNQKAELLKKQLDEKQKQLNEKAEINKKLIEKGNTLLADFQKLKRENAKLKEKTEVQPKIIEEFRYRLIAEAWKFFMQPNYLQKQDGVTIEVFKQCMKKVAIPQQNTVTRTTNKYTTSSSNNGIFTNTITDGQTAQKISSTI